MTTIEFKEIEPLTIGEATDKAVLRLVKERRAIKNGYYPLTSKMTEAYKQGRDYSFTLSYPKVARYATIDYGHPIEESDKIRIAKQEILSDAHRYADPPVVGLELEKQTVCNDEFVAGVVNTCHDLMSSVNTYFVDSTG